MRERFNHFTYTQRLLLEFYLKKKMPVKDIASLLNMHISSVYREIKRGSLELLDGSTYTMINRYSAQYSDSRYRKNLLDKGRDLKIGSDIKLANYIEDKIVNNHMSPDIVLGEIKHLKLQFKTSICTSTLYNYIYKGIFYKLSMKDLPNKGKKYKRNKKVVYSRHPAGKSIEQRPINVLSRLEFGHWEMDCVCGNTNECLLVMTERQTRKEIIFKIKRQKCDNVISCLNKLEKYYGKRFRSIFKSITVDNGSEFSNSSGLEKSIFNGKRVTIYYCHPYCSSERGSNERMNREIRRFIPKGSNIGNYSEKEIKKIETWLNSSPRKILSYASADELFNLELQKIVG